MPKFIVNMNIVEAKSTNFIIEADKEDDIYDAFGELDFTYFEKNCKWLTSEYEPPDIEQVTEVEGKIPNRPICTKEQNKKLQKKFSNIIKGFNNA